MKIRIITHHAVLNHGALLQLYGLKKVLGKYDPEVCALDYIKNYDFLDDYANVKYNISWKSIPYYVGYLKKKGLGKTLFNIKKKTILDNFSKNEQMVGEYYSRCKDLDAVFIGSDEVFSIEPGLNPFFWGMGVPATRVYAYAGCFGPTDIDFIKEKHAEEYIQAGIRRFDAISVRDLNSQNIIETLSNEKTVQVCDPVILYGYSQEKESFVRPMKEKYIIVYAYDNNMNDSNETKYILEVARKFGLKIISAGFYHKWCDRCVNVNPIELLQWINFAEYVITDTFLGTVMSLVMNTPFATKIRGNRHKLGYLLSEYEMGERELQDFSELQDVLSKKIDFNVVNAIMERKRQEGLLYIEECLKGV